MKFSGFSEKSADRRAVSFVILAVLMSASVLMAAEYDSDGLRIPPNFSGSGSRTEMATLSSDTRPFVGDSPLDEEAYKVGPGDLFQIFVESEAFERQVNPEGNILLSRIGSVHVEGLNLRDAKKLILDKLQTAYKRTNCFVNLSRPKTMRVFVTGAVKEPGIYDIPGNYRVLEALKRAGGFSPQAQKGELLILSGKETIRKVDLREFMVAGNLDANPYLCQGCVLQVPFIDFKKPWVVVRHDSATSFVQIKADETAQDIIQRSFSYEAGAVYTTVLVKEKDGSSKLLLPEEIADYRPKAEAIIEMVYARHEVFVGGAVQAPGFQPYRSDRKIVEYISRAGVLTTSKVPSRITVIHRDGKRESLPIQSPNLRPGDVVLVKQNAEQKFLLYTPILLSIVSLALVIVQLGAL